MKQKKAWAEDCLQIRYGNRIEAWLEGFEFAKNKIIEQMNQDCDWNEKIVKELGENEVV